MSTEYEEDAVHSLIREEALCRETISCAFMIQLMVLYTEQYEEGTADRTSQAFCYVVTKAAGKHRTNTSADLLSETLQLQLYWLRSDPASHTHAYLPNSHEVALEPGRGILRPSSI
jgi:hypothetical protein